MAKLPDGWIITPKVENGQGNVNVVLEKTELVKCKNCKYYCVKDFWADFHGVPVLAASNVPTCNKWANTESKVDPDGFCFLAEKLDAEKKEDET